MHGTQKSTEKVLECAKQHPPVPGEKKIDYYRRLGGMLGRSPESIRWTLSHHSFTFPEPPSIAEIREVHGNRSEAVRLRSENKELLKLLDARERELAEAVTVTRPISTHRITPHRSGGNSEAVAVVLASDWHIEERVKPEWVNGLNEYDLGIAEKRADRFFKNMMRMVGIFQRDIRIDTVVLALMGDFFSNDIHEELTEINQLLPMDACLKMQELIASGIEFILNHSKVNLVIPTCYGNHSRDTEQVHYSTEAGHSLEYYAYQNLAERFKGEKRVRFLIHEGYHTYVDVFGFRLRFHHGHAVKYQGGVGGIFIPMYKALAQWDKATRADCSFNAHFHQFRDGGNFVSNGSLIGYNAYAMRTKCDYEAPKQTFCLIHKGRGKGLVAPIWVDR